MSNDRRVGLLIVGVALLVLGALASGLVGYVIGISPEDRHWVLYVEPAYLLLAFIVGLVALGYVMIRLRVGDVAGPLFVALLIGFAVGGCTTGFLVGAIPRIY